MSINCIICDKELNDINYNNKFYLCNNCYEYIRKETKDLISSLNDMNVNEELVFHILKTILLFIKIDRKKVERDD
jgi:hypothetical protein